MFDIGFWEITLISVLGLIVLGPERLPTAIKTVGGWFRNIKQFSANVQTEFKEELRIHELHNNLKKAEQQGLDNLPDDLQKSVDSLKAAADSVNRPYAKDKKPTIESDTSDGSNNDK